MSRIRSIILIAFIACVGATAAEDTRTCFTCKGETVADCADCEAGQRSCPGDCLKADDRRWRKMKVAGHGDDELWIKFTYRDQDGSRGYKAWNNTHLGEVIDTSGDVPVNRGRCGTCKGSTTIACGTCGGAGEATCATCNGAGAVPSAWTPEDNPVLRSQHPTVVLADGRVILGKVMGRVKKDDREIASIRTHDKEWIEVPADQVLEENEPIPFEHPSPAVPTEE